MQAYSSTASPAVCRKGEKSEFLDGGKFVTNDIWKHAANARETVGLIRVMVLCQTAFNRGILGKKTT